MGLANKVVMITGGASGMGRMSAHRMAKKGAKVAIVDLNPEGLEETSRGYDNIHSYVCDVSSQAEVEATVAKITEDLGPIDRLTHCAAIMPMAPLHKMPVEKIAKLMEINYFGTVYTCMSVLEQMRERNQGEIILFGSLAGEVLMPKMGAYSATKAAVNMFAEQLINEQKKTKVNITLVCPPAVDTPLINQGLDANSGGLKWVKEKGGLAEPGFILDEAEKSVSDGGGIIYPGFVAKSLLGMRRIAPKWLWKAELYLESL